MNREVILHPPMDDTIEAERDGTNINIYFYEGRKIYDFERDDRDYIEIIITKNQARRLIRKLRRVHYHK